MFERVDVDYLSYVWDRLSWVTSLYEVKYLIGVLLLLLVWLLFYRTGLIYWSLFGAEPFVVSVLLIVF
jgi:hypothetical protein